MNLIDIILGIQPAKAQVYRKQPTPRPQKLNYAQVLLATILLVLFSTMKTEMKKLTAIY